MSHEQGKCYRADFRLAALMAALATILSSSVSVAEPVVKGSIRFYVRTKADWTPVVPPMSVIILMSVVVAGLAAARSKDKRKRGQTN